MHRGRGDIMNESNLVPFTTENASENGKKGAAASVVSKNEKKKLKEQIQEAIYLPVRDEQVKNRLEAEGFPTTHGGLIISNVLRRAGKNAMMTRVLLELLGELTKNDTVSVSVTTINEKYQEGYDKGFKAGQDELIEALPTCVLRYLAWGDESDFEEELCTIAGRTP